MKKPANEFMLLKTPWRTYPVFKPFLKTRLKKYLLYGSIVIMGGSLLFMLIQTIRAKNTGFETKTLWDWMELLIIPLFLAAGAFFLNRSERNSERQIATDRQQEAALQSFLDRISTLLLDKKLPSSKNKAVRNVARIQTLAVLRVLDPRRRRLIVQFLHEANLINQSKCIIDLSGADLEGVDFGAVHLNGVNLSGAFLEFADLHFAQLGNADLSGASLNFTDIHWANLRSANLVSTRLGAANLSGAMLNNAILIDADLTNSDLSFADLEGAYLTNADLDGANLEGANLEGANLINAKVANEQLEKAKTLEGAFLPDGTQHN